MSAEDIIIKLKRGVSGGAQPSGLTHGELAINTTDVRLYVGSLTGGVVPINNRFFGGATAPDYPLEGDRWFNGTYETVYISNAWQAVGITTGSFNPANLLLFAAGASGSGGITFSGNVTITNNLGGTTVIENGLSVSGISAGSIYVSGGATFNSNIYAPNIVNNINGITGPVTLTSGSNVTITQAGNTLTIASSGGGGGGSSVLATSSVTGVASFPNADFSVSSLGAVSLTGNVARTNLNQTFTGRVSMQALNVVAGATFGIDIYAPNLVTGVNGITGAVSITSGANVTITQSGKTITIAAAGGGGGGSSPLATSSVTGVASFPDADFSVSSLGAVSLTGNVARTNLNQTFTGRVSMQALNVVAGATFGIDIYAPNMVTGVNGITGAVSITSGSNVTITQSGKTITIAAAGGGGGGSSPLATSSVTGVASFRAADFDVSQTGSVSLTASVARTNVSQTFTGLQTFSSGISANGITGTILTKQQSNITTLGFLDLLSTAGITSTERVNITKGGISAGGGILIHSGGLSVTGGMNVTGGATVGGILSVLSQFMVQGNTANFYGDIVVSGNSIGIPDYKYESASGITWPSSAVNAFTVGDKWSNGSTEFTWVGNAWVEISNVVSSAPFDAIPDGSITPAKLSVGAPSWTPDGSLIVRNTTFAPTGSAPSYTTRAWVKFNGSMGTIALTGGNVSSIGDNGVGWYTINFTTAMPHADYAVIASTREDSVYDDALTGPACSVSVDRNNPPTINSCRIFTRRSGGNAPTLIPPAAYDPDMVFFTAVI